MEKEKIDLILNFVMNDESPIYTNNSMLQSENRYEILVFNMIYGWFYNLDHNILKESKENLEGYLGLGYSHLTVKLFKIEFDAFYDIYISRYIKYKSELSEVRKSHLQMNKIYPEFFFEKVVYNPLIEINGKRDASLPDFKKTYLDNATPEVLFAGYIEQVNYLQKGLENAFR